MKILVVFSIVLGIIVSFPGSIAAQACPVPAGKNCTTGGGGMACLGGYCVEAAPSLKPEFTKAGALGFTVSRFFTFILPLVGILGFLFFLWAGFQYLMSKGDPKALQAAQARLTYAILGLIIVFLAYALTTFTTTFFGLNSV